MFLFCGLNHHSGFVRRGCPGQTVWVQVRVKHRGSWYMNCGGSHPIKRMRSLIAGSQWTTFRILFKFCLICVQVIGYSTGCTHDNYGFSARYAQHHCDSDVVATQPFAINWLRAINKYWDKPYSAAHFILSLMSCQFHIMEHGQHLKLNMDTDGQVT